jgi:histone H3/H4
MTPASTPSSRLAEISSSVTERAALASMRSSFSVVAVAPASSQTKGLAALASPRMGRDTKRATGSGYSWPMRLGTSSPKMMVKKVMQVTTTAVDAMLAVPAPMPTLSIHTASGAAKAASPTMPLSMPMEVMPICTVERNCVGASISFSAAAAPVSPVSARAARRARRLVERAISDIANTALSVVSKASRKTSMNRGRE